MKAPRYLVSLCVLWLTGCGGSSTTASQSPDEEETTTSEEHQHARGSGIAASSEVGALDEEKVNRRFDAVLGSLQECLREGANRVEFLGGSVSFYVKVDQDGRLAHAHVEESTLGDRQTEKCMLDTLGRQRWPKPQGGEMGLARKSFEFDPPRDVRPPTDWSSDRVESTLQKLGDRIGECKSGSSGRYSVTMYVGTNGEPLAVGIAPPDERGEEAADCLVEALKSAKYPPPGSWPAKVTFSL
jgi:hypothetical protein